MDSVAEVSPPIRARSHPAEPHRLSTIPLRRPALRKCASLPLHSLRREPDIPPIEELHRSLPARTLRLPPKGSSSLPPRCSHPHLYTTRLPLLASLSFART